MIRDETIIWTDSGWFFMSGLESQEYIDDPQKYYDIWSQYRIANYDTSIIPFLNFPVGSRLERYSDVDEFQLLKNKYKNVIL